MSKGPDPVPSEIAVAMGEVLLTVKEFADLFRRHPDTIYRRIRGGTFTRFPIEREGKNIFIAVPADLVARRRKAAADGVSRQSR